MLVTPGSERVNAFSLFLQSSWYLNFVSKVKKVSPSQNDCLALSFMAVLIHKKSY